MRSYAAVSPTFWTGETGRFLRECGGDTQRVAFYLLTSPSSNMIGLYYVSLPTLCYEIGIDREGAIKALERASEGGFAHYDLETEVVYVPEMLRYQVGESLKPKDNRVKSIVKSIVEYKKSCFCRELYEKYKYTHCLPDIEFTSPCEGPPKALRSQEQEQEQEQDQPPPTPSNSTPPPSPPGWEALEEEISMRGVSLSGRAISEARGNGCDYALVEAVVRHYDQYPGAWTPGGLYTRICSLRTGQDPTKYWPDRSWTPHDTLEGGKQYLDERAARLEQQRSEREADQRQQEELEAKYGHQVDALSQESIIDLLTSIAPDNSQFVAQRYRRNGLTADLRFLIAKHLAGHAQIGEPEITEAVAHG